MVVGENMALVAHEKTGTRRPTETWLRSGRGRDGSSGIKIAAMGDDRSCELARVYSRHPQASATGFIEVCAPHIASTAAELKNRKAFARRVTKVSKEIEEHSFLNALAYSELGKALRVKWFQHDIAPIGDYPPRD